MQVEANKKEIQSGLGSTTCFDCAVERLTAEQESLLGVAIVHHDQDKFILHFFSG